MDYTYTLNDREKIVKEPIELPDHLPEDHLQARTVFSAISPGTEMAAYLGAQPLRPTAKLYPRLMGYCNLAQVEKTGTGVEDIQVGDFILTHQSHRSVFQTSYNDVLLHLKDLNEEQQKQASLLYLFHLGGHALTQAKLYNHTIKKIAIFGYGTLGLATAMLARAMGLQTVILTSQDVQNPPQDFSFLNKKSAEEKSFDAVVNTSNRWSDFELGLKIARMNAPIVCVGFPGRDDPIPPFNPLASQFFYDKQLAYLPCGNTSFDVMQHNAAWTWDLIKTGRMDIAPLITGVFPAADLDQAYQKLKDRTPGVMTYLLDWRE